MRAAVSSRIAALDLAHQLVEVEEVRPLGQHLTQPSERGEAQIGVGVHLGDPERDRLLDELGRDALRVRQLGAVALGERDRSCGIEDAPCRTIGCGMRAAISFSRSRSRCGSPLNL